MEYPISVTRSKLHQNWQQRLEGPDLSRELVTYKDTDYFLRSDESLDGDTPIYELVVKESTPQEGHLNWGFLCVWPGRVDDQYFCTEGHFNSNSQAEEYLLCMQGEGLIMMMDEEGDCWCEIIEEGSLHHIEQGIAYRLINTGDKEMLFSACWPANTNPDSERIKKQPFPCHVYEDKGEMAIYVDTPAKSSGDDVEAILKGEN